MLTDRARPRRGDGPDAPGHRAAEARWATGLRAAGAVVAGLALYVAFPPLGWWWAAPLGIALLLAVVDGRRARSAFGWGALVAVAYQYPLLSWTGTYVGALWLLALTVVVLAVALPVALLPTVLRLPGAPVWVTGVWVAGEALIERAPYGGFPWAKLAFGQADGVFATIASLGGAPLVSAAVVLTGAGLYALVRVLARQGRSAGRWALVGALVATLAAPLAGAATPAHPASTPGDRPVVVAAIQGNVPRAGLDFAAQRRAVLGNHVAETLRVADEVAAGRRPAPDLVIWPENSSDVDPFRDPAAGTAIQGAADRIGAPIVVGAVLRGTAAPGGTPVRLGNAAVVWQPRTPTSPGGASGQYLKRHLLPFGEYLPLRPIAEAVAPVARRITDFTPGTGENVLAAGPARLGVATCYEVAFDAEVRDVVRAGADLLAVPTNNATFGYTDMTYQQQGMSRLRAVEHDRAVVVAATSGQSAVIAPDGDVVSRTGELFTPGGLVETVPLRTTTTVATRLGPVPEVALAVLGLGALAAGGVLGRRARVRARAGRDADG